MDYNSTNPDGSRMQIAVIRLPAVVPVTDPRYGGAMLVNPGKASPILEYHYNIIEVALVARVSHG
jgi:hypothetical protein